MVESIYDLFWDDIQQDEIEWNKLVQDKQKRQAFSKQVSVLLVLEGAIKDLNSLVSNNVVQKQDYKDLSEKWQNLKRNIQGKNLFK
jgi:hypothetical protein